VIRALTLCLAACVALTVVTAVRPDLRLTGWVLVPVLVLAVLVLTLADVAERRDARAEAERRRAAR